MEGLVQKAHQTHLFCRHHLWRVAPRGELRERVVPAAGAEWMGAVPERPLVVDRSVGMDVGR